MNPTGRPSASASRSGGNAISPRRNRQIAALFADGEKTPTEQFWEAEKKIKAVARILVDCLDGHTRSEMEMNLGLMYRHKMIEADDLEEFSGEMKERGGASGSGGASGFRVRPDIRTFSAAVDECFRDRPDIREEKGTDFDADLFPSFENKSAPFMYRPFMRNLRRTPFMLWGWINEMV